MLMSTLGEFLCLRHYRYIYIHEYHFISNLSPLSPPFRFWLHQKLYLRLGGLSRANHPNLPFLKSVRMRNAAWWTFPLNSCTASLWTNLQFRKIRRIEGIKKRGKNYICIKNKFAPQTGLQQSISFQKAQQNKVRKYERTFDQTDRLSQSCNDCKELLYLKEEASF